MKRTLEEKQEIVAKIELLKGQMSAKDACKKVGIADSEFYRYRKESQNGNGKSAIREIKYVNNGTEKMLKAENTRLRTLVVDLMLDVQALKEYHSR